MMGKKSGEKIVEKRVRRRRTTTTTTATARVGEKKTGRALSLFCFDLILSPPLLGFFVCFVPPPSFFDTRSSSTASLPFCEQNRTSEEKQKRKKRGFDEVEFFSSSSLLLFVLSLSLSPCVFTRDFGAKTSLSLSHSQRWTPPPLPGAWPRSTATSAAEERRSSSSSIQQRRRWRCCHRRQSPPPRCPQLARPPSARTASSTGR